jgi:hypothetical protein
MSRERTEDFIHCRKEEKDLEISMDDIERVKIF